MSLSMMGRISAMNLYPQAATNASTPMATATRAMRSASSPF